VFAAWTPADLAQQFASIDTESLYAALPAGVRFELADRSRAEWGKSNGKSATLKAAVRSGWLRIVDRQLTGDDARDTSALAEIARDLHALQQELKRAGIPARAFRFETI
jgi:hypothetical protein